MFWLNPSSQFWYNPQEEEKKKQAFQPDTDFTSVATIEMPSKPLVTSPETQDKGFTLPTKALEKYTAPIEDESEQFKWLTKADEQKLMQLAGGNYYKAMDIYPTLLQQKQDYLFLKDRKQKVTENLYNAQQSKDKDTIKNAQSLAKISQFVDYIREDALKKGSVWVSQMDDQAIIDKVFGSSPIGQDQAAQYMSQYLNNKIDLPSVVDRIFGKPEEERKTTIGGSVLWWINESAQWTAKLGEKAGNFLGEQVVRLIGKAQGKSDDEIDQMVEKWYKAADQYGVNSFIDKFNQGVGADEESFAYKWAKTFGDIAQTVAPAWVSWAIGKGVSKWGKLLSKIPWVGEGLDALSKAPNIVQKWLKLASQWALDTVKYDAIANQELASPKEIALGAWLNVALGAVGAWVQKGAKALSNKFQLSGLLNAKKLEYVSNTLKETGDDVDNVAGWMQERWVAWTKNQIISKLDDEATKTFKAVRTAIEQADWISGPIKDKSVDGALRELIKVTKGVNSPEKQAVYKELQKMLLKSKKSGLSLKEIQKVKESMDDILDLYTVAGDVKAWVQKSDLSQLRSNIRKLLETNVKKTIGTDIGVLNRDTAVAKQLAKSIKYKSKADEIRELISPFAPSAIWWVVGYSQWDSLEQKLKLAALWILFGAVSKSTYLKTKVGVPVMKWLSKPSALWSTIRRWANVNVSTNDVKDDTEDSE